MAIRRLQALDSTSSTGWAFDTDTGDAVLVRGGSVVARAKAGGLLGLVLSGDVSIDDAGAVTVDDPTKVRSASVSLSADGTLANGAIVGTGAGSLGHASGVTLVAAVADKIIEPVAVVLNYTHDTAAYTDGGNLSAKYVGGADATGVASAANSLLAEANNINVLRPLSGLGLVNTALALVSAAEVTQPGTAAGFIIATTYYRLLSA